MEDYRPKGQKILMINDGFKFRIKYAVLKLFKENGIMVLDLPARKNSELQPLDKTAFGQFKAQFERLLNASARVLRHLDAF